MKSPGKTSKGVRTVKPDSNPPARPVAEAVLEKFGEQIHETAVCLTTPVPELIPLDQLEPFAALRSFLRAYEPTIEESGLYSHQAAVLKALRKKGLPNIVMTTATGSGKSLAFWSWAIKILTEDKDATVIATFPTQALLWGQADRLDRISDYGCDHDGLPYAGSFKVGRQRIPWSVWYGSRESKDMRGHQDGCQAFEDARIRICTLDKVHWSLMAAKNEDFLRRLRGVIIDEAHSWHGLSGASVRMMLHRLRMSVSLLDGEVPAFFLASATLADATAFAADLTGEEERSFTAISDAGATKISSLPARDVPRELARPAKAGLLRRFVLLVKPEPKATAAQDILGDRSVVGSEANALCFVQSKFTGHRLQDELARALKERSTHAYDADLPTRRRRELERELLADGIRGTTVVGTSALELGVDLPLLDLVVMDELPPQRCSLIQRLGRVGRKAERPGLAVLCLGLAAGDERLLADPLAALAPSGVRPLPLPLHLQGVRLRALRAAFEEWRHRIRSGQVSWGDFNEALSTQFDWRGTLHSLNAEVDKELGDLVDLDDGSWYYKGFRVSASEGKIKLVLSGTSETVASIEDIAVFRDAHPEGVYLGHRGRCYRVVRYVGNFRQGVWTHAKSPVALGKFFKDLKCIEVREERSSVATRGRWLDRFELFEAKDLPEGCSQPKKGAIELGIWTFLRKFDGYTEIDLRGKKEAKVVKLAEVARRFRAALDDGKDFPFLHQFSYRTKGWSWKLSKVLDADERKRLGPLLAALLQGFFCDAVECSRSDLQVLFDEAAAELRVFDGTPGGSGLGEALLGQGRIEEAFAATQRQLREYTRRPVGSFRHYLAEECRVDSDIPCEEVADAVKRLARAWVR